MKPWPRLKVYPKLFYLLMAFLVSSLSAVSQYNVKVRLVSVPPGHEHDSIYAAGNFNEWKPADPEARFGENEGKYFLQFDDVAAGDYEFKFTRGSWQNVEGGQKGADIGNRKLTVTGDTTVEFSIISWRDDFPPTERKHTASSNVHLLDSAFAIPQLDRSRRIWIYLPKNYAAGKKRYPVLYMHDGQNLFDEYNAPFGEWGVDDCLDSIQNSDSKNKPACIVIGIENGPKRMNEYNPYSFQNFGEGEGDEYVDFIAKTLKPYIDRKYRTLSSTQNTMIAGSSMGGLISYFAMLKYPEVFGKGGIFSPAFWTADAIKPLTEEMGKLLKGKLFFYMGGKEGGSYIDDMKDVTDLLGKHSPALIYAVVDPEASHNEEAWRKWFPEFFTWIMADGFNKVIKVED